jgi:ribosomal protein S18 acetylase RimI-like enzyme
MTVDAPVRPAWDAYASNAPAIRLYEALGFRLRRAMHVAVIERARPAAR